MINRAGKRKWKTSGPGVSKASSGKSSNFARRFGAVEVAADPVSDSEIRPLRSSPWRSCSTQLAVVLRQSKHPRILDLQILGGALREAR